MGISVLHIKTEVECRVYLFDEEKGIAKPGTYFNLEVRKGEQDLLFVSTEDETVRCQTLYEVEENDSDYRMTLERSHFKQYPKELLDDIKLAEQGDAEAQFRLGERYYNGDDVEQDYEEAVKWYRKAAEQGNASAQYCLGMCYYCYSGNVVAQDYGEAVRWFRKSAEQGNAYALYWLGRCYQGGTGVTRDYVATIELWCKAASKGYEEAQYDLDFRCRPGTMPYAKAMGYLEVAKRGYADAQFYLGIMYYCGYCVDKNHAEALRWYRKAAEQGHVDAQKAYDELLSLYGRVIERENSEVEKLWRKASEKKDFDALNKLGECYFLGDGIAQDYNEAVRIFRKAAGHGNPKAKYNLGMCYEKGAGVDENYDEAKKWYEKALKDGNTQALNWWIRSAESGSVKAQNLLGWCYYNGRGVEKSYNEAVKWFCMAAEQGSACSQNYLGMCYEYGKGVDLNYDEAEKWCRMAADQGDLSAQLQLKYIEKEKKCRMAAEQGEASAQHELGCLYARGKTVEQNNTEAVKWYLMAANQGYARAQYRLGWCFENGKGVERDIKEAEKWYIKAVEQGNELAKIHLKSLEDKMKKDGKKQVLNSSYYLFFDTETTGVPRDYKAPASNTRNWPRLVQLGWIVTDEEGNILSQGNEIVKPEGFVIPADAARVHGITTERAQREGKPLREVIEAFLKDAEQTKCIVGHNISFDQKVVGSELYRLGIPDTISTAKSLCTMQAGTDYCKIPSYYGYKWPKLQELHHKLFGCDFEDAHDAMADITATKKCFFEMRKRGLI